MPQKKNKPTKNQHVVPQIYLNNFGTPNAKGQYQIIVLGKRKSIKNRIDIVKNVGYIKNFYDVDREDATVWETFYAKNIEPLYCNGVNNLIARTILSVKDEVLDDNTKLILSKIIIAQWLRVPSFMQKHINKTERQLYRFKRKLTQDFLGINAYTSANKMWDWQPNKMMSKDLVLSIINDEERLEYFASILASRAWSIYYNCAHKILPFITCDDPIISYNMNRKTYDRNINGIGRPDSTFVFPLSPQVAVQIFYKIHDPYFSLINNKRFFFVGEGSKLCFYDRRGDI